MKQYLWIFILLFAFSTENSWGFFTEVGVSYSRKKTSFDDKNYTDSESSTGSVSLYFLEKMAVELSYTDGNSLREENIAGSQYTTFQKTKVIGADLIYVMAERKAFFQPYIKGGGAQLTRQQVIKVNSLESARLDPEVAVVPSYGFGFKLALTDSMGVKVSYDGWKTPLSGTQTTDDSQLRVGLSWIL
jgi:hypothetical protein